MPRDASRENEFSSRRRGGVFARRKLADRSRRRVSGRCVVAPREVERRDSGGASRRGFLGRFGPSPGRETVAKRRPREAESGRFKMTTESRSDFDMWGALRP